MIELDLQLLSHPHSLEVDGKGLKVLFNQVVGSGNQSPSLGDLGAFQTSLFNITKGTFIALFT